MQLFRNHELFSFSLDQAVGAVAAAVAAAAAAAAGLPTLVYIYQIDSIERAE